MRCKLCNDAMDTDHPLSIYARNPATGRRAWMHFYCFREAVESLIGAPAASVDYDDKYDEYMGRRRMITTTHELADALYALGIDAAGQRHTIENYATPQEAVADMDRDWLASLAGDEDTSGYGWAEWLALIQRRVNDA